VKIAVDTNVLVRAAVGDGPVQASRAATLLRQAERVIIPTPCLCEFVWVLRKVYAITPTAIAGAIRTLIAADNVDVHRLAVDAGLAMLEAGGDFADGAIAAEGYALGAEQFHSFDDRAVRLLQRLGHDAQRA
jgi:predicted nucleic-acid-binding protein